MQLVNLSLREILGDKKICYNHHHHGSLLGATLTVSFRSGQIPPCSSIFAFHCDNSCLYPSSSGFFLQCLWISALVYPDCICSTSGDSSSQHDWATLGSLNVGFSTVFPQFLNTALTIPILRGNSSDNLVFFETVLRGTWKSCTWLMVLYKRFFW